MHNVTDNTNRKIQAVVWASQTVVSGCPEYISTEIPNLQKYSLVSSVILTLPLLNTHTETLALWKCEVWVHDYCFLISWTHFCAVNSSHVWVVFSWSQYAVFRTITHLLLLTSHRKMPKRVRGTLKPCYNLLKHCQTYMWCDTRILI